MIMEPATRVKGGVAPDGIRYLQLTIGRFLPISTVEGTRVERSNLVAVVFFALGVMIGAFSVLFIARNDTVAHAQLIGNRCSTQTCQAGALPYW